VVHGVNLVVEAGWIVKEKISMRTEC